ncbi:hypothetical protein PYCC9005_001485 [Savitreella phatthalungensis]
MDYEDMPWFDLVELAKTRGVYKNRMKKPALLSALRGQDEGTSNALARDDGPADIEGLAESNPEDKRSHSASATQTEDFDKTGNGSENRARKSSEHKEVKAQTGSSRPTAHPEHTSTTQPVTNDSATARTHSGLKDTKIKLMPEETAEPSKTASVLDRVRNPEAYQETASDVANEDPHPGLSTAERPSEPERSNAVETAEKALEGTAEERHVMDIPAGGVIPDKDREAADAPPPEREQVIPGERVQPVSIIPEESVEEDGTAKQQGATRKASDIAAEAAHGVAKRVKRTTGQEPLGGSAALKEELPSFRKEVSDSTAAATRELHHDMSKPEDSAKSNQSVDSVPAVPRQPSDQAPRDVDALARSTDAAQRDF